MDKVSKFIFPFKHREVVVFTPPPNFWAELPEEDPHHGKKVPMASYSCQATLFHLVQQLKSPTIASNPQNGTPLSVRMTTNYCRVAEISPASKACGAAKKT